MKKKEKLRAIDSNPYTTIQIPHKEHEERTEERIRIPYIAIRIPKTRVLKNKARRFESSSYGFKSLLTQNSNLTQAIRIPYTVIRIPHGAEFKFGSSDLNPLNSDSNPWFCRSIKFATCNSSYLIFKSNLSPTVINDRQGI